MRVVLDTNVLISALLKPNSTPARVLELWRAGEMEVLMSPDVIQEVRRVLEYPRITERIPAPAGESFLRLLESVATNVDPGQSVAAVSDDPDDDMFASLALAGRADYIISGDMHLLDLVQIENIPVVTPAAFLLRVR